MKYSVLLILVFCESVFGCVIGPEIIMVSDVEEVALGFSTESKQSDLCKTCSQVNIDAPIVYEKQDYSHSTFAFYLDDQLVTKNFSMKFPNSTVVEFAAIIALKGNWKYEVSFVYGDWRCASFELIYVREAE